MCAHRQMERRVCRPEARAQVDGHARACVGGHACRVVVAIGQATLCAQNGQMADRSAGLQGGSWMPMQSGYGQTIARAGCIFRRANRGAADAGTADVVLVVLVEGIHAAHQATGRACARGLAPLRRSPMLPERD